MTDLTPRREATVGRLVEAAITQFAARGIDATSVEQLCDAAGFTRGAFYSNFASKDDLCTAIIERYRDNVLASLSETIAELPPEADVKTVASTTLEHFLKVLAPSREMKVTLTEIRLRALRSPGLAAQLEQLSEETRPALVGFIESLAARMDVKFALPTEHILTVFDALYSYEIQGYNKDSVRQLLTPLAISLIRAGGKPQ